MRGENWRFWAPVAVLTVFALYSSYRLVLAHVKPEVDAPNYYFTRELPARRGSIYSAQGKNYPFVKSVPYWEYALDPVTLTNRIVRRKGDPRRPKGAIVKTIADTLGLDFQSVMDKANSEPKPGFRAQRLGKSTSADVYRTLADSSLVAGVVITDRQIRQYIQGKRLCHVLGSVNADGVGSAGLEQRFDRDLAGTPGTIRGMRDARKAEIYDKRQISIEAKPGSDIYLTVDHNIQCDVEESLKWGLAEFGAGSGWSIVMDARSAAILAMASFPDYDPTKYGRTPDNAKINRAIGFNYEPGSVMKVITAASAIDAGFVTPATVYRTDRNDSRYYKLPGDGSHVWEPTMTIKDAIVHSSNIVIGKLGYDFTPLRLYPYMKAFGFGSKTGIELPGEQFGILPDPRKRMWDRASWSRGAIGQFVSVTAIQLISAYQAIANDGIRMKPYIVDRIVDSAGNEVYRHEPTTLSRVISAKTARTMRKVMLDVASPKGTARRAAISGYSIAGKTGTAQKQLPGIRGYAEGLYRASFCGIVPADDPRLVVLVTLDFDARTKFHQGGNSAGPVFKRITSHALKYLMIPPDKQDELEELEEE